MIDLNFESIPCSAQAVFRNGPQKTFPQTFGAIFSPSGAPSSIIKCGCSAGGECRFRHRPDLWLVGTAAEVIVHDEQAVARGERAMGPSMFVVRPEVMVQHPDRKAKFVVKATSRAKDIGADRDHFVTIHDMTIDITASPPRPTAAPNRKPKF